MFRINMSPKKNSELWKVREDGFLSRLDIYVYIFPAARHIVARRKSGRARITYQASKRPDPNAESDFTDVMSDIIGDCRPTCGVSYGMRWKHRNDAHDG